MVAIAILELIISKACEQSSHAEAELSVTVRGLYKKWIELYWTLTAGNLLI
jgi:hypothetical protein